MLLLSATGLTRGFDAEPLFQDLSLDLYNGQRAALVGPNGAGKTTLLRILAGIDEPDSGVVNRFAGAHVAILQQHETFPFGRTLFEEARSALDQLLAAQEDLVKTAERLAATTDESERKSLSARFDRLTELLHHQDAYTIDHKVETVLEGLGFHAEAFGRPVNSFSGGQQRRLLLAKLLLAAPDVMLLDEPSNHLDIEATRWLENYLIDQRQAMLIVSHDRFFLDRVVTQVFELHQRRVRSFPGNYHDYVRLRRERYELELKEWESQREYIEKQEEYIRRVHYGQLAKQAQSRRKALERLIRVERPTLIESPRMHFEDVARTGDIVIDAQCISKSYDRPLFADLSFAVNRGQRLGILGPNGCGKTTLLRILLKEEQPDAGTVHHGARTQFGYFDQHLRLLADDDTVLRAVWPSPDPSITEQHMRNLLGRFGLSGDIVHQKVGALSGGERSRTALARLVAAGVNVLVLDEPTNHLDIWACEALEEALKEFEGTVIVVSHDRYFLNEVCGLLIVFEDGRAQVVFGNYDLYERLRAQQQAPRAESERQRAGPVVATPAATSKSKHKRRFAYRKLEDLEAEIAECETTIRDLERALADGDLYRDAERVRQTMTAFEEAKVRLARLYEHWDEAAELN
jgi:ATP-binding cassette, subfamily F, member 3